MRLTRWCCVWPPLLPCVGQLLPRSWQAAMAMLRALRDGRAVTGAVQRALRAVAATGAEGADAAEQQPAPEPESTADAKKRLSYLTFNTLGQRWAAWER